MDQKTFETFHAAKYEWLQTLMLKFHSQFEYMLLKGLTEKECDEFFTELLDLFKRQIFRNVWLHFDMERKVSTEA